MLCKKNPSVSLQNTIILTMVFGLQQKLFSSSPISSIPFSSFLPISPELLHPPLPHSRSLSFSSHAASISLIFLNPLNMWSFKSNLSCVQCLPSQTKPCCSFSYRACGGDRHNPKCKVCNSCLSAVLSCAILPAWQCCAMLDH